VQFGAPEPAHHAAVRHRFVHVVRAQFALWGEGGGGGVYGACEIKRDVEAKEEESALEREDRKLNRNITRGQVRLKVEGRCSRCIPWGQP
jgi:hypothetical protein